jgi:hypothetical protein
MALTPEQRARLEALSQMNAQKIQQTPPQAVPSGISPERRARLEALSGSTAKIPTPPVQQAPQTQGLISRGASLINRGVEGFANLPVVKQLGQLSGAALGVPSAIIGGTVAAIGTPIANVAQGKPVFQDYGKNIKENALKTGKFGYDLGSQAPTLGAMQTIGRIPNLVIGASQTIEGVNQTREAIKAGDTAGAVQSGITTGIGVAGTILGARQKGLILDDAFVKGTKSRIKGVPAPEMEIQKYEKIMQDVLQPGKAQVKQETRGILARARKERAGASVVPQKTTARVLVEEGVVPSVVDEGGTSRFRTAEQVVDMDNRVAYANDKLEEALARNQNPQFDLVAKKKSEIKAIGKIKNIPAAELDAMEAEVGRYFDAEIARKGRFVTGEQYNQVKRSFASAGDYKNLSPGQRHMRQVSESIGQEIARKYADEFDVNGVNKVIGNYIRARNELQALDGAMVKGGGLTRRLAQMGGAIAAGPLSNIPLVDNIIGGYLAGKAQQYAVSPARRLSGLRNAPIESPAVSTLDKAEAGSIAAASRQASLPRLPAPRTPLPDALSQYIPSRSGLMSQEQARQPLKGTLLDPSRMAIPLRGAGEVQLTQKEIARQTAMEAKMLKQQLDEFRFPEEGMEASYKDFKRLVARDKSLLDPDVDSETFRKKYGKRANDVLNNATSGGGAYGMYDNDAFEAFKMRYQTEKRVEAQIERMKKSPATQSFNAEPF